MARFKNPTEPETRSIFEKGILSRNPVLVYAIGICPLIAVAKSAATAAVLAFLSAVLLIFLEILTALIFKKMPKWLRIGVYAITGILLIIPFYMLMNIYMPSIEVSLGIYIPLLAVNSLTVQRCEAFAVKHSVKSAFLDAAANSIGYAIPLILTGIIREALGSSSIFGHSIDALPHADGFLMPFCGFIILGFVAAFINYMRSTFRIGDEFDTKDNDFVIDKSKAKEKVNGNNEDSLQSEIASIPESISEPVESDTAVQSPAEEDTEKKDSSANFESSVNRIMHKWSPLNSVEVSEEITPEAKSALNEKNNAISEIHTDTENSDAISADNAQPPAPKTTTRKRTAKKSAVSDNVNTDSAFSDKNTETKELSAENAVVSDTAEASAPKKTTRKRTTKKSAVSDNVNTDSASSDESTKTSENNTLSTDMADNTATKKTTRKRTKKTESTKESAKIDSSSENSSKDETAAPLKKTTRKRTTKKTESQTQETESELQASEQVAAPKKTTRRRTTPKSTETPSPVKESALKED